MRYGYNSQSGTCFSYEDEKVIDDIIENCSYEPDTPINTSTGEDDPSTGLIGN